MQEVNGITATELHGADPQEVIATALAGDLTLQALPESEAQRAQRLLQTPYVMSLRNAAERRCVEAGRIAADLSIQRMKDSGELRRRDDWRALVAQVQFGDAL